MKPQPGPIDAATYRLGPGDLLELHVWGPISQTLPLEVGPEGRVFVPGSGSLPVTGLTLAEARERIERLVRAQYRGVRVETSIQRLRTLTVYLSGEVKTPGPVSALGGSRVADVVVDSLLQDGASRRNIVLRHRDGRQEIVDLGRFRLTGVEDHPSWLEDGDVIEVPRAVAWVGVWGGVARQQRFELGPRDSLRTLLELAGGTTPSAMGERLLLVQWNSPRAESTWISLADIRSGAVNPALDDGANLFVYFDPDYHENPKVTVIGQVQRGGTYPIVPNRTRLSDAINAAGGFRSDADLSTIHLVRLRPEVMEREPELERLVQLSREEMTETEYASFRTRLAAQTPNFRVDWRRLQKGDPALDPLLSDGDVVRVERLNNVVRVDGQVRHPGVYEYRDGAASGYYVKLAGGYTERSARGKVRVTRAVNGQTVLARRAERIEPGDFVWVPERADVSTWQRIGSLLTIAAQAATVYIAVRR